MILGNEALEENCTLLRCVVGTWEMSCRSHFPETWLKGEQRAVTAEGKQANINRECLPNCDQQKEEDAALQKQELN